MQVTLTPGQIEIATLVGKLRNSFQRGAARADDVVHKSASLDRDVHGAIGELAVAVAMGEEWTNALMSIEHWLPRRHALRDVGALEVKTTTYPRGCLLLQAKAAPEPPYILALAHALPRVTLAGWLYGHEIMTPRFWRADVPRPCYMAPQKDLRRFDANDPLLAQSKDSETPDQRSGVWRSEGGRGAVAGRR